MGVGRRKCFEPRTSTIRANLVRSFYVHVGTPPQIFHVLPSFNGQTVYVPIDKDCERFNVTDCGGLRGVEIWASRPSIGFHPANSSSWSEMGTYRVGLGANFGLTGNGKFGNDTVGLGTGAGVNAVNIDQQAVVAYATSDVWVGQLGLSKWALNMSDTVTPHSFLSSLKEGGYIPSLSFGYQAGAFYREFCCCFEVYASRTYMCRVHARAWLPHTRWLRPLSNIWPISPTILSTRHQRRPPKYHCDLTERHDNNPAHLRHPNNPRHSRL
jgi:hypothetical protein